MKPDTDTAAIAARFEESARAFTPINKVRFAKLHPFRAGITQLRQKGAGYPLIRALLADAGLETSVDHLGNFVREVIEGRVTTRRTPPTRQRTFLASATHPSPNPRHTRERTRASAIHRRPTAPTTAA